MVAAFKHRVTGFTLFISASERETLTIWPNPAPGGDRSGLGRKSYTGAGLIPGGGGGPRRIM